MTLKTIRLKKRMKLKFDFDIEVWFATTTADLTLIVYDEGNEVCSKFLTFNDLWNLIDDNEFWEPEEREETKQRIIRRMKKFIAKLEKDDGK